MAVARVSRTGLLTLLAAAALVLGATGCASKRLLRLENQVLQAENERLRTQVDKLEAQVPDSADFVQDVDLDVVAGWLDRAGFIHSRRGDGPSSVLELEYDGRNADFTVTVQHFPKSKVLFLATHDYLRLDDAPDSRGVVLLLVKLAALNYDLLIGKFQLDPDSGDILLSAELHLGDGLGYGTFVRLLEHLLGTADDTWPQLHRAAKGQGL